MRSMSDLNKKVYATIEAWRNRPIEGEHPYVYLDGIVLKRSWAGEVRNVALLVAIGVNESGYRDILGICEGAKEDKAGWSARKHRVLESSSSSCCTACINSYHGTSNAFRFIPQKERDCIGHLVDISQSA
jgi:transposase-like protein